MKDAVISNNSLSQDVTRLLTQAGIATTPQRIVIAQVLFAEDQHITAEQLFTRINRTAMGTRVSKATVYNTLGLFVSKGLLRELFMDATGVVYDTNTRPHHHFYNLDTGRLTDIEEPLLPLVLENVLPDKTQLEGIDVVIRVRNRS